MDAAAVSRLREQLAAHMQLLLTAQQRLIEVEISYSRQQGPVHVAQPSDHHQDTEDFSPLNDAAPPPDERYQDEDATVHPAAGRRAEHHWFDSPGESLADYELWNDEHDGEIQEPQCIQQADSTDFGQENLNYSQEGSGGDDDDDGYIVDYEPGGSSRAGAPDSSTVSYNVDSLHDIYPSVFDDDFYPPDEPSGDDQLPLGQQIQLDVTIEDAAAAASGSYHGDRPLHLELIYNVNDEEEEVSLEQIIQDIIDGRVTIRHHIVDDTPAVFNDEESRGSGSFGGVPASAAAIAGLKKHKFDGSSGADGSRCVICMRDYKKGKRLVVMPCEFGHRFHRKCLKKWLSRSSLCPLCRHALPTEKGHEQQDVHVESSRV